MKVLIACEYSGRVREAFRALGHDARSCDLLPADDGSLYHYQCDVAELLDQQWDLMIAHPPCTYLTGSAEWAYKDRDRINKKLSPDKLYGSDRRQARQDALLFIDLLWNSGIPRICIENPVGVINQQRTGMPKPQYIHPYMFGDGASKRTGLWLHGLPALAIPDQSQWVQPRNVELNGKQYQRWSNQTDSGQSKLPPSADRWKIRSLTYSGVAAAMAANWG